MLIVQVADIKPGMTLASPVSSPAQPDVVLLKAGYVLDQKVINRLPDYGIEMVYVQYPGLDDLDRHIAVNLSPARQQMYQQMKSAIAESQKRTSPKIPYTDYYETSRELILTLLSQGKHPVFLDQLSRLGNDAVGHATSVAHLSLLIGIKLETYLIDQRKRLPTQHAKEVVNLGVAGMLHDIGKMRLPAPIRDFTGAEPPADPNQRDEWEQHTRLGYEMCHDGVEPTAASAILHHHQHCDGSGFPVTKHNDGTIVRPAGQKIHIFARILHAADLYDRLCTPLHGKRRSNLEVLHLMRTQYAGWLDPSVLEAIHALCPPFPPGSTVTLSNGARAIVVQVDGDIYKPTVRKMLGDGVSLDTNTICLRFADVAVTHVNGLAVQEFVPA